jgi:nitroreductase
MLADLVARTRSCRRFDASHAVDPQVLRDLVDIARLTASGGNLQPLKYKLVCDPETSAKVFACLRWAGYLTDWSGPEESERPTAYIVIVRDNDVTTNLVIDHGIAAQTIMLAATERGLAGCIMGSIDRNRLKGDLGIPASCEILLVLALGKPGEKIVMEVAAKGEIRYWRDPAGVHHVPKRPLDEVILK